MLQIFKFEIQLNYTPYIHNRVFNNAEDKTTKKKRKKNSHKLKSQFCEWIWTEQLHRNDMYTFQLCIANQIKNIMKWKCEHWLIKFRRSVKKKEILLLNFTIYWLLSNNSFEVVYGSVAKKKTRRRNSQTKKLFRPNFIHMFR